MSHNLVFLKHRAKGWRTGVLKSSTASSTVLGSSLFDVSGRVIVTTAENSAQAPKSIPGSQLIFRPTEKLRYYNGQL